MAVKEIISARWGDAEKTRVYGVAKVDGVDGDWHFAVFDGYDTELGQEIWDLIKEDSSIHVELFSPSVTASQVDQERDRRIDNGFLFNGVAYQYRPEDRENIAGTATAALAAIMNGAEIGDFRWADPEKDFEWIAADNSTHKMDAQTAFTFGQAAMKHKQDHIFAARALKDATPIPADFPDDKHWPTI